LPQIFDPDLSVSSNVYSREWRSKDARQNVGLRPVARGGYSLLRLAFIDNHDGELERLGMYREKHFIITVYELPVPEIKLSRPQVLLYLPLLASFPECFE